jgi:hypothetical protein
LQCIESVCVSTHWVPHSVEPLSQPHLPLWQCVSPPHVFLHAPQLASSVCNATHPPLQTISPVAHCDTHLPPEHTSPLTQGAPHDPQLLPSARRLVQPVPHWVSPVLQMHCPLWQFIPWPHTT